MDGGGGRRKGIITRCQNFDWMLISGARLI
jgi:hypothetical protein